MTQTIGAPSIFGSAGIAAQRIGTLGWFLTITSIVVTLIVVVVLLIALLRRREAAERGVQRLGASTGWIVAGGVIAPGVILVAAFAFTVVTQAAVADAPSPAAATIEVIGHRWWWEIRYTDGAPDQLVVTANEMHVPVGRPVQVHLTSTDVIHSFWVAQLAGKTDLIPGQQNTMWIEADRPGTYLGQCAEYCGLQHAHMSFAVVAESPAQYAAWLIAQRAAATPPADSLALRGMAVVQQSGCAACHTIRGGQGAGRVGPDLTHLDSRLTIAAGALRNTPEHLAEWIAHPQSIKPGNAMPTVPLTPSDSAALRAYLATLH